MALNASTKFSNSSSANSLQETCSIPQKVWYSGFQNRHRSLYYYSLPLLLLQIITFIFIKIFLWLFLRPFGQPMIISEILAGILVGPTMLGSYDDFRSLVFPVQAQLLSDTLAWMGVIYYLFVEGLKQDIRSVTHASRKELVICLTGMLSSFFFATFFVIATNRFLPDHIKTLGLLKFVPGGMALTNFPVVQPILGELGLLNTELGRLSMTLAVINNALAMLIGLVNQSIRWSKKGLMYGFLDFFSTLAMWAFLFTVAWPATMWVVRRVPSGGRVGPDLVFTFLLLPLVAGAVSDLIGAAMFQATLLLGMMVPPGPPLASVLVEKIEPIERFFFLPLFFVFNGRKFSLFDIPGWSTFGFLLLLTFSTCVGKFFGTLISARFYKMPHQESVTLALIMCLKGIIEVLIFCNWMRFQLIDSPTLACMEVAVITVTAIATPLVRRQAKRSTRPLFTYDERCMELSRPNSKFRLLMCVHDEDNVPTLLNLLNASSKKASPINLCILHIVELVGRGMPVLTAHKHRYKDRPSPALDPIFRAFENLAMRRGSLFHLMNSFTSISPHKTMHQDVCAVATDKQVCLVIVPLHKRAIPYDETTNRASRLVARNILYEAPCSVGVLFDRSHMRRHVPKWTRTGEEFSFSVGIVFLGGGDDREALCYVSRMVENPGVSLMVLHCVAPYNGVAHHEERLLDRELMGEFRLKALQQDGVVYREETVANVEEMVNSIRSMGCDFDLVVVGRRHEAHSFIVDALMDWSECIELGVIGDFFASSDFANCGASVLSIQQKMMSSYIRQ